MSLSRSPENTQIRVNAALDMIGQAADPLKVRFAVAYAIGTSTPCHDDRLISIDGAELYRQDALCAAAKSSSGVWRDPGPRRTLSTERDPGHAND